MVYSPARYLGTDPEPRPNLPSGHIPRSYSVPFTSFLQTNSVKSSDADSGALPTTYTSLKSNAAIHEALQSAMGEKHTKDVLTGKRVVTTSCGSGMTAGVVWLGLKLLGVEGIGLYDEVRMSFTASDDANMLTSFCSPGQGTHFERRAR